VNGRFERQSLGHGIGLRPPHYAELLREGPYGVDWFEVISEDFFAPGGRHWAALERVRREVPVALHGVSLGIGSVDPIPREYLKQLAAVIERVEPAWVSDHLCWAHLGGTYAHELLPLPYTREVVELVVGRVSVVQDALRRPILLENVSAYLSFAGNDLSECDVLNEIADRAGCGLLVDVNNVVVCATNLGIDARRYLEAIEPRFVGQIHLAGHTRKGNFAIDSHVGPVPVEVWELYALAAQRFGRVPTLIEWDDDVPPYARVVAESLHARSVQEASVDG
jgi:uncharacterized protein (UPF0276 family)